MVARLMPNAMTVLLTGKDAGLIGALRQRRPDLNAMAIGTEVPESAPPGSLWCFVDWLLPDISGLEMCRRLRLRFSPEQRGLVALPNPTIRPRCGGTLSLA